MSEKINIATAHKRNSINWRNQETTWGRMVDRLGPENLIRTTETVRQYKAMSKDDQGAKKDVGGFVGGKLRGRRRKSGEVLERSLITLDADNAPVGMWNDVIMLSGYRMLAYSTHSHTPDKPRLRFVIPMSRPVTSEEYVAIARKVADWFGIEAMDTTTYQPERLMYWPSCPSDGEYEYHVQEGPVLDPDEVLCEYGPGDAWKDTSLWPIAKSEQEIRVKDAKVAGEPTEKPGIVGKFCQTYDVPSAIANFLPDIYEECATGDRYTYIPGSTAAGAVVYNDGAFLYSNHATDPAGGQLCNAFDLVRIHKFGALDGEGQENQEMTRRKSYVEMCKWAVGLDEIKEALVEERMARLQEKFGDIAAMAEDEEEGAVEGDNEAEEDGDGDDSDAPTTGRKTNKQKNQDRRAALGDWAKKLTCHPKTGELEPTIANAKLILMNDPRLAGKIGYNEFKEQLVRRGDLPWRQKTRVKDTLNGEDWTDPDDSSLLLYMEHVWGFKNASAVSTAVSSLEIDTSYHPVREYLNGLTWDGVPRIDELLIKYLGAEDNPYTRAVMRKWMCAAVARIMNPGCKFDEMLVLIGPQGTGKSTLAYTLSKGWFSDSLRAMEASKESFEQLGGTWIVEIAELSAAKRSDGDALKNFITKTSDKYRPAYGHRPRVFQRQCVFFGTTNNVEVLKDRTGARRFWPVEVVGFEDFRIGGLAEIVDQLWAEAMVRYKQGESLRLDDPELERMAKEQQARYSIQDEMEGQIEEFLDTPLPENWDTYTPEQKHSYIAGDSIIGSEDGTVRRDLVCVTEIRVEMIGEDRAKFGGNDNLSRHISDVMNNMPGWRKLPQKKRFKTYGPQWAYQRT